MPGSRLGLLLLLAVLAAGVAAVPFLLSRHRADAERAEALRAAQQGHFREAESILRRVVDRNPQDLDVVKALALGYLGDGQMVEAESELSRWCLLRPDDAQPFKQRMDVRHRQVRGAPTGADQQRLMQEALSDGRRALEIDPEDGPVAQEVVWLMTQVGQFEEADALCRRCLRRQPGDPWLTYLLAKIAHCRGAAAEARTLLDSLLRQHPQFTQGLLLRAELHNEAGEPEKAIPLLRQVLSLDRSQQKETRYHLSLALARAGQTEEAQRVMAELQKDYQNGFLAAAKQEDKTTRGQEEKKKGRD
jgi:tetratricopeptide (TPR) repeat protein